MILLKACPRCGGDVNATFEFDAYCVQCGHRPDLQALRRAQAPAPQPDPDVWCRACHSDRVIRLDRRNEDDHLCYRCGRCGHIFSPRLNPISRAAS